MAALSRGTPRRGEIWFVRLPTNPPGKGPRPVLVVSLDSRNRNERATTVVVIPLTASVHKESFTRILLPAGETGLAADSSAKAEDIVTVPKVNLIEPRSQLRQISHTRICEIARAVQLALGCLPSN